jgi:hypothetical protein
MKKFLAVLISAFLVLSLSTVAMAVADPPTVTFEFTGTTPDGATAPSQANAVWQTGGNSGWVVNASAGAVGTYPLWSFDGWKYDPRTVTGPAMWIPLP